MNRTGWYEREEINKITEDWVKLNCKNVTKREKELLKILNRRKLIRRDHLEIIHPSYRNAGKQRTNILNRSIRKLFDKMCIDKVHEEKELMKGNTPAIISLDKAGAFLIGTKFRRRIRHNKRMVGNQTYVFRKLPANYLHVHGVNELEVKTIQLCENNDFDLIRWDLEQENAQKMHFEENYTLIPDIFTIIKSKNKLLLAFIEYDTGTEDDGRKDKFPTIRSKLKKYKLYSNSGLWKKRDWAMKINTEFPILLFVTEDKKRINYINEKGNSMGLRVIAMHSSEYVEKMGNLLL